MMRGSTLGGYEQMKLVRRPSILVTGLLTVPLALAACKKDSKEEGGAAKAGDPKPTAKDPGKAPATGAALATGAAPATGSTPPPDTAKAPSTASIKVHDELMAGLKAMVAACTIEPKDMKIECPGGEDKKLTDGLLGYSGLPQVEAVPTLAVALADADPKMVTVATDFLGGSRFTGGWGEGVAVGAVSKDVAGTLLAALPKLPAIGQYHSRRAVVPVIYAASLADMDAEAHAMLEAFPDKYTQKGGWEASAFYGRLKPFPKLEAMAKDNDRAGTMIAATAINNMYALSADEAATLCPWAHSKLGADKPEDGEAEIFGQVGFILAKCRGEWIDKMQDWADAQLKDKKFDRQYYFVFRELCHDFIKGQTTDRATEAQCERNFAFLEKVANTDGIDPTNRGYALSAISYQRRDAKSMALMKKYAKHKVKEVAEAAAKEIKMLESYVK